MHTFILKTDYIELNKLMKLLELVESGGDAKHIISEGLVSVNGETELRIRRKLRAGDVVVYDGQTVTVVSSLSS